MYKLGIIGFLLSIIVLDFLLTAGVLAIICWAFSLVFSWKLALGIWCIILLLQCIFKPRSQ